MKTETPSNRRFTIKAICLGVILIATLAAIEAGLRVFFLRLNSFPYIAHMFRDDPITGFALTPNMRIHAVGDGNDFILDTNSMGLRGKEPLPRGPDECRILVMGDSYTYGIGVDADETYSVRLETRLRDELQRPVRVFNAGGPGFGTVQELAFYRTKGPLFDADAVLLGFFQNDPEDNLRVFKYADGFLFENPSRIVSLGGHPIFLYEFIVKGVLGWRPLEPGDQAAKTREVLLELKALAANRGQPLLVACIPDREDTRFAVHEKPHGSGACPDVPELRMLDLSSAFATATTTPFLPDHHINKVGHRIVGDALVPWAVEVCRAHAAATAATPGAP